MADTAENKWLTPYVPGDNHTFSFVERDAEATSWHHKTKGVTDAGEWRVLNGMARRALRDKPDGIITVFPQLASLVSVQKQLRRSKIPVLSWFFNTNLYDNPKRLVARAGLRGVNRFVVHTRIEAELYAEWLSYPMSRFHFVPMQFNAKPEVLAEPVDSEAQIFTTGSGFRDYKTFFTAVDKLGYPTLVVAGDRVLEGLTVPKNVRVNNEMPRPDILRHVRRARVNVLPMNTDGLVAGTVTIAQNLALGRAMVATRRQGVEDYLLEGNTALLVEPDDAEGMAERIEAVWTDESLRHQLDAGAHAFGQRYCTDDAAATALGQCLDNLTS